MARLGFAAAGAACALLALAGASVAHAQRLVPDGHAPAGRGHAEHGPPPRARRAPPPHDVRRDRHYGPGYGYYPPPPVYAPAPPPVYGAPPGVSLFLNIP